MPDRINLNKTFVFYVYFLQSIKNKKYYTGLTGRDPKLRLAEHNKGCNKWTRENGPFVLVYFESYQCKLDAEKRELFYKSGFGKIIRNAIIKAVSAIG